MTAATDPATEAAVAQLDRLAAVARNLGDGLAEAAGGPDPDPLAVARLTAAAADAADRLLVLAPDCLP